MRNPWRSRDGEGARVRAVGRGWWQAGLLAGLLLLTAVVPAQETVCARVKIEIVQELTLERQAFDAEMRINNALDNASLSEVEVTVKVTEENGTAVPVSGDPNDTSARFFLRLTNTQHIENVSGGGVVAPASTAVVNWLLIPAPGAGGNTATGKRYLVGATLRYKFGSETHTLEINPDAITVKPLPQLGLDYFLTQDIVADDPLTAPVEPSEPFTLGVRIKNGGAGLAKTVKIDSAQPKIVDNAQGLPINFKIIGSYVQDAPAAASLLIDFGDIGAGQSKTGRWVMETNLAGRFVDFSAGFTHADELGGALTSLITGVRAHFLTRDVRVDLPGRDLVRDFLAKDADGYRVYESDGSETLVTDRSAATSITAQASTDGLTHYRLSMPATSGAAYTRIADPFAGQKGLGAVLRSDAKVISPENVWLSKSKNPATQQWDYWINLFDVATPGSYDLVIKEPPAPPAPPEIAFVPDVTGEENQRLTLTVQATSPNGKPVSLSAAPLPSGASFQDAGGGRGILDWTPAVGQAGSYLITYTARDGERSATRSATIQVQPEAPPVPGEPTIVAPASGAEVPTLTPTLQVMPSAVRNDPTQAIVFELYADAGLSRKVADGQAAKNPQAGAATVWTVPGELEDNTHYYWRARAAKDAETFSQWVEGRFFVNLFNDAPEPFNLSAPAAGVEVASATPTLVLTNAIDRDGDALSYGFAVYADAALTTLVASVSDLAPGAEGSTAWTVPEPLVNHATYTWLARATDTHGAVTRSVIRSFVVNTGNTAPSDPVPHSPVDGAYVTTAGTATLVAGASSDAENDPLAYEVEVDTVATFDSGARRFSGPLTAADGVVRWTVNGLIENQRYYWRIRARDGRTDSAWRGSQFLMNAANEAPPAPTVGNPGHQSWVATQSPTFEANPVVDPEGEAVSYRFEIYRDAGLTQWVVGGVAPTTDWTVPQLLTDKRTFYWRVRAEDSLGAASAWSLASVFYVSTGAYVDPSLAMLTPASLVDGRSGSVELRWEGTDHNLEASLALYYDTTGSGYQGTLITDQLTQVAGTVAGSYRWDVSGLAPGAYYVYGVIRDPRGSGRAYAGGAVVIPSPTQSGGLVTQAANPLRTVELGPVVPFTVWLKTAPRAPVVVPVSSTAADEATASPAELVFTPANWNVPQTVNVQGEGDCARDGSQSFGIVLGRAISLDPDYIGVAGPVLPGRTGDGSRLTRTTGNPLLTICAFRLVEARQVDAVTWDYHYQASLTNLGAPINGLRAQVTNASGYQVVDGELRFGALGPQETARSRDTIVLRGAKGLRNKKPTVFWNIEVTP